MLVYVYMHTHYDNYGQLVMQYRLDHLVQRVQPRMCTYISWMHMSKAREYNDGA